MWKKGNSLVMQKVSDQTLVLISESSLQFWRYDSVPSMENGFAPQDALAQVLAFYFRQLAALEERLSSATERVQHTLQDLDSQNTEDASEKKVGVACFICRRQTLSIMQTRSPSF